jgi:5-methylcytosine-specific restriction endonuclease McrA
MNPQSFYSRKLTNPLWQRKRLDVFNRDNFSCTRCGNSKNELQVHHLDYIPGIEPWEYPLDMLTTLCIDCHAEENARQRHENYLLNSLKMKGFLVGDILRLSTLLDTDPFFTNTFKNLLRKGI